MFNASLLPKIFFLNCTQMLLLVCIHSSTKIKILRIYFQFFLGKGRVHISSLWSYQVTRSYKHIFSPFGSGLHILIPLLFCFVFFWGGGVGVCNRNADLGYINKIEKLRMLACLLFFFFSKDFETTYHFERLRKEWTFGKKRFQTNKTLHYLQGFTSPLEASPGASS